jgi:hypothetical protein
VFSAFKMANNSSKPPTNYRKIRSITERNLVIGFIIILLTVGVGLIGLFYGGGAVIGGLSCILLGIGLLGVVAMVMVGLGRLSEWLDRE